MRSAIRRPALCGSIMSSTPSSRCSFTLHSRRLIGGCAEDMGRAHDDRPAATSQPMPRDEIQTRVHTPYTRDGRLVRHGDSVMPGGPESFIAYGRNWANVSNTPFREYKHFVHEGGISTPLIAHWPHGISRSGAIESQPGHLIDIIPTCLDLAGAKVPPRLPGISLLPALRGESL